MNASQRIFTTVEVVTPEIAAAYLRTSKGNRTLKEAKVRAYARDMKADRWTLNGETIIFNDAGELIDGHHRLTASVRSASTFQTIVIRGVCDNAQRTIDMGASRTIGDALSIHGRRNANEISAIATAIASLRNGRPRSANPSSQEIFEFVERHPEIEQAAVVSARKHMPRGKAILGAIWLIACKNGEEETANRFLDVIHSAVPSMPNCPAHSMRERIIRDASTTRKMPLSDVQRLVVAAWEKFRRGEQAKFLKIPEVYTISGLSALE